MSHVRPEDRSARSRRSDCRKGRHSYGEDQNIGAGLLRRVCELCASVAIDLTGADELTAPVIKAHPSILSMASQQTD